MPKPPEVIAVVCSDIHLSETPPPARAQEPDWFLAMKRPLDEMAQIAEKYDAPILCCGDIFDKYNPRPELVNFAIAHLPKMIAIPGQHDLPHHNYQDIDKSAYWTLVESGTIANLIPERATALLGGAVVVMGFPWGCELFPYCTDPEELSIALVHKYTWAKHHSYPGAPTEGNYKNILKQLAGFDVVCCGDNHQGFLKGNLLNCGGFMRRKSDEVAYCPAIGLIYADGTIKRHFLDTTEDVFHATTTEPETRIDLSEFVQELNQLQDTGLDFKEAVRRFVTDNKLNPDTESLLMKVVGI